MKKKMLKSSQSRIAKMESGDPTVSIDLLIKSLLTMGATKKSIAKVFERIGDPNGIRTRVTGVRERPRAYSTPFYGRLRPLKFVFWS